MHKIDQIKEFAATTGASLLGECLSYADTVSLTFSGENQTYTRLNQSRIRQTTEVLQGYWSIILGKNNRFLELKLTTSWNCGTDTSSLKRMLSSYHQQIHSVEEKPKEIPLAKAERSEVSHRAVNLPDVDDMCSQLSALKVDCAGLIASGSQWVAYLNHLDTFHWFSQQSHFFDYSFYTKDSLGKNRALKNVYFARNWDTDKCAEQLQQTQHQLSFYSKKARSLSKGNYRVYLTPRAMRELLSIFYWNALGLYAFKKGYSFLHKLYHDQAAFSPKVTLSHDLSQHLAPTFNSWGEVMPQSITLIERGLGRQLLVSTISSFQFDQPSNKAPSGSDGSEYPISLRLNPGSLPAGKVLKVLDQGVWINDLHYLNVSHQEEARITGMTRFGAFWVENGEVREPLEDFRFDVSLYDILGDQLEDLTDQAITYPNTETYFQRSLGDITTPGAVIKQFACVL